MIETILNVMPYICLLLMVLYLIWIIKDNRQLERTNECLINEIDKIKEELNRLKNEYTDKLIQKRESDYMYEFIYELSKIIEEAKARVEKEKDEEVKNGKR